MNRYAIAVAAAVVIVAAAWWLSRSSSPRDSAAASAGSGALSPAPVAGRTVDAEPAPPFRRVVRLTREQRRDVAAAIAAARAHRAPAPATAPATPSASWFEPGPELAPAADPMERAQQVLDELMASLDEVKRFVAECVATHAPGVKSLKADLALTGDPDIGSLIDASGVTGPDDAPVAPKLDDCIRSQLQTLALPPIKSGDGFTVSYVFEL